MRAIFLCWFFAQNQSLKRVLQESCAFLRKTRTNIVRKCFILVRSSGFSKAEGLAVNRYNARPAIVVVPQ